MYIKKGKLCHESNYGNPVLQNTSGQAYEVSFVAAFIWERLDGSTPLSVIEEEISRVGDISREKLRKSTDLILRELQKVGLVSIRGHEISY